jgi:hypothetical protein
MKNLFFTFSILIIAFFTSCSSKYNQIYEHTDYFVESLETTYDSYGAIGGMDYMKFTEDGKYQIFPMGRLINVKILEDVPQSEYEDLREDLENYYEGDERVNQVYICSAGTVMVDCRN